MTDRLDLTPYPVKPLKLYAIVLLLSFGAEFVVMSLLPYILPIGSSVVFEAIIDSCLLTLLLAPALWFWMIRPIQQLAQSRMLFLRRSMFAQESERQRLRQELHDGIGQSITSVLLHLRAMEESPQSAEIRSELSEVRKTGADILVELRRLVSGLHPAVLDTLGLSQAIEKLVRDMQPSSKAIISTAFKGMDTISFERNYATTVYRIVQEGLANAIKHANAAHIRVELSNDQQELHVRVQDDGIGMALSRALPTASGNGLISIRERVMSVGGQVEVLSSEKGTTVHAVLPARTEDVSS
ncbi:Oxygen sensor histidine kinase NreB [Pirellula sp. SH-Sr6A]|uniref:sensor histidine kinase n=1 Tax=Pirellula sp. SH-Sr6A TaxID=1632865 RepID=UPI00078E5553|nr:sensor histidine kinase [Pirellula sp. SH-Sr6A]AMV33802.1 Oxygen sensor histidine kinase NreB [Pirellula sp. SH-Sr6A]